MQAQQPPTLSAQECAAIRRLASDIPDLWQAPTTTSADRQAIIRHLVERIVVTVQGDSEQVEVQIHWRGGTGTRLHLARPVARLEQLSYYPQLVAALHEEGHSGVVIAEHLNAEGWRPAKRRATFAAAMVNDLLARQGLGTSRPSPATQVQRRVDEWTVQELARELAMPLQTLHSWLLKGRLNARKEQGASHPIWLIRADAAEITRLRSQRGAADVHSKSRRAF